MIPDPDGTLVKRQGMYYFLEPGVEFWSHSMLGGHWFEGHPFQTGPFSTAEEPKPQWVNGAMPVGPGWPPDPHCCCGAYPAFTCARVEFTVTRTDTGVSMTVLATTVFQVGDSIQAHCLHGHNLASDSTLPCPACTPSYFTTNCGPLIPAEIEVESGVDDPSYVVSLFTRTPALVIWPGDLSCRLGTTRVRYFR
jgi:hypothetical protein